MKRISLTLLAVLLPVVAPLAHGEEKQWLDFQGKEGAGKGKKVVLLSGDEEYRSEEGLPQLAKILSEHHGFDCTVCFSINKDGEIDPNTPNNEPGMEALDSADACIMLLRFRNWPDAQMKHFVDYYLAGKPIIGLRTATHAFAMDGKSPYAKYTWNTSVWPGGFGRQVLGETWVNHWGGHKSQATLGVIEPSAKDDPILRGVSDWWPWRPSAAAGTRGRLDRPRGGSPQCSRPRVALHRRGREVDEDGGERRSADRRHTQPPGPKNRRMNTPVDASDASDNCCGAIIPPSTRPTDSYRLSPAGS